MVHGHPASLLGIPIEHGELDHPRKIHGWKDHIDLAQPPTSCEAIKSFASHFQESARMSIKSPGLASKTFEIFSKIGGSTFLANGDQRLPSGSPGPSQPLRIELSFHQFGQFIDAFPGKLFGAAFHLDAGQNHRLHCAAKNAKFRLACNGGQVDDLQFRIASQRIMTESSQASSYVMRATVTSDRY